MIPLRKDLTDEGLDLVINQFYDKERFQALLRSFLQELDDTQDDLFDLVENFNVDDAEGYYLDLVGKIVGLSRNNNESDNSFRRRIKIRILVINSDSTPNALLEILKESTLTDNVNVWEHYPLSFHLYTDGVETTKDLVNSLREASAITSDPVRLMVDFTGKSFRCLE